MKDQRQQMTCILHMLVRVRVLILAERETHTDTMGYSLIASANNDSQALIGSLGTRTDAGFALIFSLLSTLLVKIRITQYIHERTTLKALE